MAQMEVTVPYRANYDFGIGVDLATGSPMGKVALGEASGVTGAQGAKTGFQISRITSTADLEKALQISVEASGGSGCFGASARMDYAKNSKVQSSSLFMAITSHVELENLSIDDPQLTPPAVELAGRQDAFIGRFGNMFVRGIGRGGLFVAVLRFDTHNSEESETISAKLSGSYGAFSADASTNISEVQKEFHSDLFISVYHEGGPIDLTMGEITDPRELYVMLQAWLKSFQDDPVRNSVPYMVTLAPIAIANGPIPPNAAEIQHAQDVLMMCARERSRLLDGYNLMSFILQNPARYEFVPPVALGDISKALNGYQLDLDLVADAAAYAIDHVGDAMAPSGYAAKTGKTYPQGLFPEPMPTLEKGATDALAAKGELLTNQDPLAMALRDQQPDGPTRRGFYLGMGAAERQTLPGPGKDKYREDLPEAQRGGFSTGVSFSLMRNRAIEWAEKGAAVVRADPEVASAARANSNIFYCLGFDVATGIYGRIGGNTATGAGGFAIRDALADPDAIRGFNDAVKFHLGPPLRPPKV